MHVLNKYLFVLLIICFCGHLKADEFDEWLVKNWRNIEKTLMPIKPYDPGDFPKDVNWEVKVRIEASSYDDPLMITMRKYYTGKLEVTIKQVSGDSLEKQVRSIYKRNPEQTVLEVANQIIIDNKYYDSNSCSVLSDLADIFENTPIMPIFPDILYVHGTRYIVLIHSQSMSFIQMEYIGAGPGASIQRVPIIDLIEKSRILIDQNCQ